MNKLIFHHADGTVQYVKERTIRQIYKVLARTISQDRLNELTYLGNQRISECNGNIYADFYDARYGMKTTLYVADYYDYIGEIKE